MATKTWSNEYDPERLQRFFEKQASECRLGEGDVPYVQKKTASLHPEPCVAKSAGTQRKAPKVVLTGEDAELMDLLEQIGVVSDPEEDVDAAKGGNGDDIRSTTLASSVAGGEAATVNAEELMSFEDDSENTVDVEELIRGLQAGAHPAPDINLNNHPKINADVVAALCDCLCTDTHAKILSMTNCKLRETCVDALCRLIEANAMLEEINLDTNRFTPGATVSLCKALLKNPRLRTFRIANQYTPLGAQAEGEVAELINANTTICKFAADFKHVTPRQTVDQANSRNMWARHRRSRGRGV